MTRDSRSSLGPVAVMLAVCAVVLLIARLAHAAADPTPPLTGAVDTSLQVWTTDGPLWLAIAVVYVGLRTFLSRQHWLAQGRLLAGITGLVGVGAAAIQWHFSGAPVEGVLTALIAAIALVQHPVVPPATARKAEAGLSSLTTVLIMAAIGPMAVLGIAMACTATQARQTAAAGVVAALDCEASHLDVDALADAKLFAAARVQSWISGTSPANLPALKARILDDLRPIKSDLGRCAIAGALAAATTLVQQPGVAASALSAPVPDARAAFSVAAREAGWAPVRLAVGAVL